MYKEISDNFWTVVEPLFEPFKRVHPGGSPSLPFRTILNGIFFLLKTGCQWCMIPEKYGSKSTIHEHFQKWVQARVFQRMHQMNVEGYDELKGIQWDWQSMDGALIVAPTRQAGGASAAEEGLGRNPTDRGRQGSKLHTLVERNGIPLAVELVGANVHDSRLVGSTLENIVVERPEVTEEKPQALCLDKGYSYKRVEEEVLSHSYEPHIRRIGEEKKDGDGQKTHPAKRWVVERTNAWFKGFRALRTRYTCKGRNFLALIQLAASIIVFQACHPKKE